MARSESIRYRLQVVGMITEPKKWTTAQVVGQIPIKVVTPAAKQDAKIVTMTCQTTNRVRLAIRVPIARATNPITDAVPSQP